VETDRMRKRHQTVPFNLCPRN